MALRNPALSNNPAFRPAKGSTVTAEATALATADGLQQLSLRLLKAAGRPD